MIGEVIGNFRLMKRLGRGGMGEVFLGEHKDQGTQVAIKLLNGEISDNHEQVQRFFNEARVVSKIRHAGTVKIFDSGFAGDRAYLIMELLEGDSLAKRLERGPMEPAIALATAQQIASVLDATHRQGIIHRDLKPDNIYLIPDDERGERVKILDFGIAKLSGTMAQVSPKTSGTMGTPAYMSPEQWSDSSTVDWRADAYALGCVIFEMVCGRPPFLAQTIPEAYTKHVMTKAPRMSSLIPTVPPGLDDLVARLLAKEPSERAVAMEQIVRELSELSGVPVPVTSRATGPTAVPRAVTPAPTVERAGATTLGGSATSIDKDDKDARPARSNVKFLAIGGGVFAVIAIVVIVALSGGSKAPAAAPVHAIDAAPAPVAIPAAVAPVPADAAVPVDAPIDAAPPPPPRDAAAVAASHPQHPVTVKRPQPDARPATITTPPPPPPDDGSGWGGRL